ncbi:hypothetical protein A2U01_0069088, partial [Trifolium medium]|nr:hypothetical protein [Trifolium medium]
DGSLPKPSIGDPLYAPWIRCSTTVLAWIHRSISKSIARSVLWIDSATGVWKNLKLGFRKGISSEYPIFRKNSTDFVKVILISPISLFN